MKIQMIKEAPLAVREYLGYMETVKGKSPNTVEQYFTDLRIFFRYYKILRGMSGEDVPFSEIDISDITLDDIKSVTLMDTYDYMNYLREIRNNKPAARARKAASLRSFYKFLYMQNKIDENPLDKLETAKIKKSLPKYLTLEDSIDLLSLIDGDYAERNYCIVTLFLNCGLRLSELVNLDITDIRRDDTMRVVGKGNKERTVYLNRACIDAINSYLEVRPKKVKEKDKNALFISRNGNRISREAVQLMVKNLFTKMGIAHEGYSVHKLRHTAATLMYQYGQTDIRALKEILGHENLNTTEIYTHISDNELKKAAMANPLSSMHRRGKKDVEKKKTDVPDGKKKIAGSDDDRE